MLIVISPAKKLDFETRVTTKTYTVPDFLEDSSDLVERMRDFSALDLAELMHVSSSIAELNFDRFHDWNDKFTPTTAKPSIFAFQGDVYTGLDADSLNQSDLKYAQNHLRILSGLYGVLRPLDLMKAYRLEMGTKLENSRGKNLYEFWGNRITEALNEQMKKIHTSTLVNLASNEYFKSVKTKNLNGDIVTPVFKDYKNGEYKMIGFYAKKARGLMTRFIIKNRITETDDLQDFDEEGYRYNKKLSTKAGPVFTRRQ